MDRRLATGFALISLPVIFATVVTIFACRKYERDSKAETQERESAYRREVYRRTAEELQLNPDRGIVPTIPKDHGRMRYMRPGRWGYVERSDGVEVWYQHDRRSQSVTIDPIKSVEAGRLIWPAVAFALFSFWAVTIVGCLLFRKTLSERDNFVAATAHDFRTPLECIRRVIGADDEEAKSLVDRLLRMTKNMSEFLKRGGRQRAPEFKKVNLRSAIAKAYRLFENDYRWLRDGEDPVVECAEDSEALADEEMMDQILWNLFANEMKYAVPHGPFSVRVEADEKRVRLLIADVGPGISPRDRKRIFRRYFRASDVRKTGKGGYGLGLFTARAFATAMGGDLRVRANEPSGCVFELTLRRA